jgi:futalosine hydrolase
LMELEGCKELRAVTRGCRLILLAATDTEAEPLLRAFRGPETYVMATKKVVVGVLGAESDSTGADDAGSAVRTVLAITGCDKVNAAHVLSCLLLAIDPRPSLVLQVGVAGAFPGLEVGSESAAGRRPAVGDLVLATEEIYSDTGCSSPAGWLTAGDLGLPIACVDGIESGGRFPLDPRLVGAAVDVVRWIGDESWPGPRPAVFAGPCVTSSRVTGTRSEGEAILRLWGALAESMEGAAAAHVCALHGTPFLEVRGISNLVVDRERASWEVTWAVETAGRAALALVAALDTLPLSRRSSLPERPPFAGA